MTYTVVTAVLASIVFVEVVCRLAAMPRCSTGSCPRAHVSWHLWMGAHVTVAVGALAIAVAPLAGEQTAHAGVVGVLGGTGLLRLLRWRRRRLGG